jgi:hypothetical protein
VAYDDDHICIDPNPLDLLDDPLHLPAVHARFSVGGGCEILAFTETDDTDSDAVYRQPQGFCGLVQGQPGPGVMNAVAV